MTAPKPLRQSPANRVVRWLLHAPLLRRLLDRWVCELSFVGARTGRDVVLPVMYAGSTDQIVVLVGHASAKHWWRSFVRPHPVRAWLRGQSRPGIGRVVAPGSAERSAVEEIYVKQYPGVSTVGDPFVVVNLVSAERA